VASLSASRVSHDAVRRMQVWSARGHAEIDFSARTASLTRPSDTILAHEFDVDKLAPAEVERLRTKLMEEHLPRDTRRFDAFDALVLEIDDFVDAIHNRRPPRVTGQQGLEAVRVAEQILASIDDHSWDGKSDGLCGPHAKPRRRVIPAPHFVATPAGARREAG
jgi:predicted dehydrogenase